MNFGIPEIFIDYFSRLFGLIFTTKNEFDKIFDNRNKNLKRAITFFVISMSISLSFAIVIQKLGIVNSNETSIDIKNIILLIPTQLVIFIPLITFIVHIPLFVFGAKGSIYDTLILVLYSYVLAPFSALLTTVFFIVEKALGYPFTLFPIDDEELLFKQYFSHTIVLIFSIYILVIGIKKAHNLSYIRSLISTSITGIIMFLSGYSLVIYISTKYS